MGAATNKQPKQLYFVFAIELWERFGFYIMRSLLVLYLTQHFNFSDAQSYALFGGFTAFLWLTPVIGGYVAENFLDYQRCIAIGGALLALGYGLLAIPHQQVFYYGLGTILMGNGLLKPAMPSLLGTLYPDADDPRRGPGFTIYYMGINIGGSFTFVGAYFAQHYGYSAGFLSACIGMCFSLIIFFSLRRIMDGRGTSSRRKLIFGQRGFALAKGIVFYLGLVALIYLGAMMLSHVNVVNELFIAISIFISLWYLYRCFSLDNKTDRNRMLGCFVLTIFGVVFWVLYQQAPMTIILFTKRNVVHEIFGHVISPASYMSLNPIFIILLTPLINKFWLWQAGTRIPLSTTAKFAIGTLLMGLGFIVLTLSVLLTGDHVSSWWLVLSFGLQSLGELALAPIGLAMMTALAPKDMVGMMIGLWFFSSAVANCLSGYVAQWASLPKSGVSAAISANVYQHVFLQYGAMAIAAGLFILFTSRYLDRMLGEGQVASA